MRDGEHKKRFRMAPGAGDGSWLRARLALMRSCIRIRMSPIHAAFTGSWHHDSSMTLIDAMPRIPDTSERKRLGRQRGILLTTLGIVTGVGSAENDRAAILITGGLALLVGALSMGVGEYLGEKSEREVVQSAIDLERREMIEMPDEEFAEQIAYYCLKGFTHDEALTIVNRLVKNPEIWLHEMVRDEFGIDLREAESGGLRATFAIAGSFALGGALPVLPYVFPLPLGTAMWVALLLAVVALFGIGVFAASHTKRNPIAKGLEIVAFGALVFVAAWACGRYIPPLFGHGAISVGG